MTLIASVLHAWFTVLTWCTWLFAIVVTILCLWWRWGPVGRLMSRIPAMEKPWPIVGNLFHLLRSSDQVFEMLRVAYSKHRGINRLSAFNIHYVNIYEPDDIEKILSTPRFNEKRAPYTFLRPWLSEGLLVSNGEKWLQRRKILTSAFHFRILRKFSQVFGAHGETLAKKLRPYAHGHPVHLMLMLSRSTLTLICETSMGISMHERLQSISEKYFYNLKFLGSSVLYRTMRVWLHPWATFYMTGMWQKQKNAVDNLHEFTDSIINERKAFWKSKEERTEESDVEDEGYAGKKGRHAMLDLLLQNLEEGLIDSRGIREEVDTFMFEGHDTTAAALQFLLLCIANEAEVQDRIYEEQELIFSGSQRCATTEDLAEMRYLECCVKEALRLFPSVPYIARYLHEDVTLSGYLIPAGTVCNIHIYDVHRRADLYPEPERFKPERFLPEASSKRHPYAYLPFSAGPRNCIGQKFAMLELKALTSCVVRRYHLKTATRLQDVRFTADMILRASRPVLMRLVMRDSV